VASSSLSDVSAPVVRNVSIIAAIAAVVAFAPHGAQGAGFVRQVLNAAFIVVTALMVGILYRQYRAEIFGLGDQWRFVLYAAVGIAIVTIAITRRMWATSAGSLLWIAILGTCSYVLYVIWQRYRSYA
jgi:predicted neutral ceramidase superfamily lipid hydrolase